jgi:hypothetical protein
METFSSRDCKILIFVKMLIFIYWLLFSTNPHSHDKKLNSVAFSPQANYTDRATAACRRGYSQLLRIEGVAWSARRIPTAVNLGFLDRSRYFSIQAAPELSSRG